MNQIYLAIICLYLSSLVYSKQFTVCKSCEIASITNAIENAGRGDTILVKSDIYYENNIKIEKPIVIIGLDHPTIDAQNDGYIFEVLSDSVTIKGLTLINVGSSYTSDYAAIRTYKISEFIIEDNIFRHPFFAILIEKSKNGIIRNNEIYGKAKAEHNSGNGIHIWHASQMHVLKNKIRQMRDGIYFEFVKHSIVEDNDSRENIRYGLHFMFSNDDKYENNIFENNGAGVAVMFSKNIYMRKNTFKLNWGTASYGLLLKEIYDGIIIGNSFEENTIGVNADGANRMVFENNTFKNNGWAMKFLGACYGNKLLRNNFLNNAFDIAYSGGLNGNLFDKNYWSEYSGYDLNKDGFGDVPYRPVKLFSYVVNRTPEAIVLLRSLFVDIINFSERVSPVFTPDNLKDFHPLMKPHNDIN